jgi:hypothetical protein
MTRSSPGQVLYHADDDRSPTEVLQQQNTRKHLQAAISTPQQLLRWLQPWNLTALLINARYNDAQNSSNNEIEIEAWSRVIASIRP